MDNFIIINTNYLTKI